MVRLVVHLLDLLGDLLVLLDDLLGMLLVLLDDLLGMLLVLLDDLLDMLLVLLDNLLVGLGDAFNVDDLHLLLAFPDSLECALLGVALLLVELVLPLVGLLSCLVGKLLALAGGLHGHLFGGFDLLLEVLFLALSDSLGIFFLLAAQVELLLEQLAICLTLLAKLL